MKIITILSQIFLLTASFTCADSSTKNTFAHSNTNSADKGFAVVELFTSEGCSSCPPADNAVAKLLQTHNDVYVLAYHVDYWDNLGWKDVFSNAAYTQIQKEYAKLFKLSSIYTPQVVVNGAQQFVGSNEVKLNAAVNSCLQQASTVSLDVEATLNNSKTVTINYKTSATNADIKIALVQLSAIHKIQNDENSGATLHHVNIVRDIKKADAAGNGNVVLNFPAGLSAKDCKVIAFIQNKNDDKIVAAEEVGIE